MIRFTTKSIVFITILLLISIYFSTIIFAQDDSIEFDTAIIKEESATFFDSLTPDSNALGSLTKGDIITVVNKEDSWVEIKLEDGVSGYLQASELEFIDTQLDSQEAITLQTTNIYIKPNQDSQELSELQQGTVLSVKPFWNDWYATEVSVDGDITVGYILEENLELATKDILSLSGVALVDKINVYSNPSTSSDVLKGYSKGSILKFQTFTSNWYKATVLVNGNWTSGYIHKKDVEVTVNSPVTKQGVANQSPTKVYSSPSTSAGVRKSYPQGAILKYQTFTSNWYKATVYVSGKRLTGYIHKNHVEEPTSSPVTKQGIATQSSTKVYSSASTSSKALKSYSQGSLLKYQTFTSDWYKATVYVKGKKYTGYIHKNHVEEPTSSPVTKQGIATQSSTKVYNSPSTSAGVRKSYPQGAILKYQTFTSDWFKATVYVKGKKYTGYIHKNHVEEPTSSPVTKHGVSMKAPTKVYSTPNKNSRVHKSYQAGNILKYETFTSDWYKATVYIKGKKHTGYIHKNDVEEPITNQKSLEGIAFKGKTHVYSGPHRNSKILKSYNEGTLLKYRTYLNNWYQATVYVNGKKHTGYIHKKDVFAPNKKQTTLTGMAVRPTTYVYQSTSTSSKKLKGYKLGSSLKYETYTENWYRATVYINNKKHTGYIHKNHVGERYIAKSIVNPKQKYSYNKMQSDINKLLNNYPGLITREVIGKSVEGRNIDLLKVGFGDIKITVNASHHGREWMTTNLVMYQIDQYAQAFANNRKFDGHDVRDILSKVTIYFVPMVNPDGVTLSQFGANGFSNKSALIRMNKGSSNFTAWKSNARGVDLNRQYPADWAKIKNNATSPSYAFYKGTKPLTEPEAKAVYDLALKHKFATHVAYHSSGEIIYWAFKEKGAQLALNRSVAQLISNKTGYPLVPQATNPSGGGYKDWAIDTLKAPGFTIEISPYVVERPVPLSYFDRIWRQNNSIPLILAKEAAIRNR